MQIKKKNCHSIKGDSSVISPLALACAYVQKRQSPQNHVPYLERTTNV